MTDFRDLSTKQKKNILITVIISLPIIAILLTIIFLPGNNQNNLYYSDNGPKEGFGYDRVNYFDIVNGGELVGYLGQSTFDMMAEDLRSFILTDSEISSAPHENIQPDSQKPSSYYDGTITELKLQPNSCATPTIAYDFILDITDGREYHIYLSADAFKRCSRPSIGAVGEKYLAVLFERTDLDKKSYLSVIRLYGNDNVDADVSDWLNAISKNQNDIEIKNEQRHFTDIDGEYQSFGLNIPDGYIGQDKSTIVTTIDNNNWPTINILPGLPVLQYGDRVKLHYACPNDSSKDCVAYKYDLYR